MNLLLMFLCCSFQKVETKKASGNKDLEYIQSLWVNGETKGFTEVVTSLAKRNEDPSPLWLYGAKVLTQKGRVTFTQKDLDDGRRMGFRCLMMDKSFSSLVGSKGGQVNRQAIEALDETDPILLECAQWTTIGWALWLHERGPQGASHDIEVVRVLASWIHRYNPNPWTYYGIAITEALLPMYSLPNWSKIQKAFEQCLEIDELVAFEHQYYLLRRIDLDAYCQYSAPDDLSKAYQERWLDSRRSCVE